jgi:hypothetical protein
MNERKILEDKTNVPIVIKTPPIMVFTVYYLLSSFALSPSTIAINASNRSKFTEK